MVLNDWKDKVMSMFSRKEGGGTRRPDGGTSCYRPLKRRSAQEPAAQGREADQQPMTYVHTGFTGMTPPVSYGGMQDSGRNPAYGQTGYNQAAYDQTAWQPNAYSQATGYMQQSGPYTAFPEPSGAGRTHGFPSGTRLVPPAGNARPAEQYLLYAGIVSRRGLVLHACGAYHDHDRTPELL